MGALCKLVDAIVLIMFVLNIVLGPLHALPDTIFPDGVIRRLRTSHAVKYQDYLILEMPHFYVAMLWLALVFQWPLALLNVYGFLTSKPWFNTTCLIFGASKGTSMAILLGEMMGSRKASGALLLMYSPFMGFAVLALLLGLLPQLCKAATPTVTNKGPAMATKKRA